jgi:hypothetical protein
MMTGPIVIIIEEYVCRVVLGLLKFTKENNSIHPSQIGFLPGHRTADHILTIKTLTDKYVNQKTNGRLYVLSISKKHNSTRFCITDYT